MFVEKIEHKVLKKVNLKKPLTFTVDDWLFSEKFIRLSDSEYKGLEKIYVTKRNNHSQTKEGASIVLN